MKQYVIVDNEGYVVSKDGKMFTKSSGNAMTFASKESAKEWINLYAHNLRYGSKYDIDKFKLKERLEVKEIENVFYKKNEWSI